MLCSCFDNPIMTWLFLNWRYNKTCCISAGYPKVSLGLDEVQTDTPGKRMCRSDMNNLCNGLGSLVNLFKCTISLSLIEKEDPGGMAVFHFSKLKATTLFCYKSNVLK